MLNAFLYDGKGHDREVTLGATLPRLSRQKLLWIDVTSPTAEDKTRLRTLLKISDAAVFEEARERHETRLATFGNCIAFDLVAIQAPEDKAARTPVTRKVSYVFGDLWVVTLHDGELPYLDQFRQQDRGETLIGGLTGAGLVSSLLDWHLDTFLTAAAAIETLCDDIDVRILAGARAGEEVLREIVTARRHVAFLLRLLEVQRPVFYGLARADIEVALDEDAKSHVESLARRFERTFDVIQGGRNLIRGSFDLHTARLAENTNTLVRRLTFLSVMLGIVGAVAGIFGMNFDTRIAHMGEAGFWAVLAAVACFLASLTLLAGWRKWL